MVGHIVDFPIHAGVQRLLEEAKPLGTETSSHHAPEDHRIGLNMAYDPGGFCGESAQLRGVGTVGLPVVATVGLVPYFIVAQPILKMANQGGYVGSPSFTGHFSIDGSKAYAGGMVAFGGIKLVAIANIEPWNKTPGQKIIYDRVQPCEVIDTLLLFGLGPARLYAYPFDARSRYNIVAAFRIEAISVQRFKSNSQPGGIDLCRASGANLSDFSETWRNYHNSYLS